MLGPYDQTSKGAVGDVPSSTAPAGRAKICSTSHPPGSHSRNSEHRYVRMFAFVLTNKSTMEMIALWHRWPWESLNP